MKSRKVLANHVIKFSWISWIICTLICLVSFVAVLIMFRGEELPFTKVSDQFSLAWFGLFLIGCLFFAVASFATLWSDLPKNIFLKLILMPLAGAIFPLYLLCKLIKPKQIIKNFRILKFRMFLPTKKRLINTASILTVIFIILPVWVFVYAGIWFTGKQFLGLIEEPMPIVGTGSMAPTWPKGESGKTPKELSQEIVSSAGFLKYPNGLFAFGKNWFGHQIGRGDIVTFNNQKTEEIGNKIYGESGGFLKRVVAMSGDTVEIRDGLFILNGQAQKEPYIAHARSTFGGAFLPDCKVVTVPENMFFAMGDNRKGSGDSRQELGFVSISDIDRVIPWDIQKGVLDKSWHDTTNDLADSSKISIDKNHYLELLNAERKKAGSKPLKYEPKLEESAKLRGEKILEYDDLSWEATRSGYPMWKAMSAVNYSNITYGEAPSLGLYEADELLENQLAFAETKKFLFNNDYQEVGIAEIEHTVDGCPKQITVAHFGGYVPPNYSNDLIDSWEKSLAGLRNIQPGWSNLRSSPLYNSHKEEVDKINEIISLRISRISTAISKMRQQKWLSNEENKWLGADTALSKDQEVLADKLNSY